jgi:hypothetical protein
MYVIFGKGMSEILCEVIKGYVNLFGCTIAAYSDKINGSCCDFVRTWGYFGQNWQLLLCFCLNPGLLQTKLAAPAVFLSEPGAISDKTGGLLSDFVRTWSYFRQNWRLLL